MMKCNKVSYCNEHIEQVPLLDITVLTVPIHLECAWLCPQPSFPCTVLKVSRRPARMEEARIPKIQDPNQRLQ